MCGHSKQVVEKYLQLTGKDVSTLKMVATPCIDDHMLNEEDMQEKGELHVNAARIVLEALYVARVNRPDIYWAVNTLAREVTKWTKACDRRVHRLVSYLHWTADYHQKCWVGDEPQNCVLALFVDASFAGYLGDSISSTGAMMCLVGPNTFVPIQWLCKKQTAVSHSSTEAEVISLDTGVRLDGIPALIFWELVIEVLGPSNVAGRNSKLTKADENKRLVCTNSFDVLRNVDCVPPSLPPSRGLARLIVLEDNEGVIKMLYKGRSRNMRHVTRTMRIDIDWLFERLKTDKGIFLKYVNTNQLKRSIEPQ